MRIVKNTHEHGIAHAFDHLPAPAADLPSAAVLPEKPHKTDAGVAAEKSPALTVEPSAHTHTSLLSHEAATVENAEHSAEKTISKFKAGRWALGIGAVAVGGWAAWELLKRREKKAADAINETPVNGRNA